MKTVFNYSPHAGRKSTKHFWSFTTKQHCSVLLNKWSRWGRILISKKTTKNKNKMAPYPSSGIIQVSVGPEIQNCFEKTLFSPSFEPILSLEAAKLKAVGRVHELLYKCCRFSVQCEISGLLKTLIMPDELYWAIIYITLFVCFFKCFCFMF